MSDTLQAPTLVAKPLNGMVALSWTPPAYDGGSNIKTFVLYRGTVSGQLTRLTAYNANTFSTNDSLNGVTNGTKYFYQIAATNDFGEGPRSAEVSATPLATIGKPGATSLKSVMSDGKAVTVTWTAPVDNGLPITQYRVYRATHPGAAQTPIYVISKTLMFVDTNVTPGATYHYAIAAENAGGAGPAGNELSAKVGSLSSPQSGVPFAPTILKCQGVNNSVQLAWLAPPFDGLSDVKTYRIYRNGVQSGAFEASRLDTNDGIGIVPGTKYTYEITAGNDYGEGPRSAPMSTTPVAVTRPGAPTLVSVQGGDKQVTLTWSAPSDTGGSPITGYKVFRGTTPGSAAKQAPYATVGTAMTFKDSNVLNDNKYFYVVTAMNEVFGGVVFSNEMSATPTAGVIPPPTPQPTVPSAPTSVKAAPASILLSWAAPGNDGGSPVTGYKIYRGRTAGGETFLAQVGLVTNYTDSQISPGTTYFYKVTAVNAAGESPLSVEVSQ